MDESTQPLSSVWPDSTVLVALIDELRDAGYKIGVNHYIAAHNLFLALFAQAPLPEPQRLKTLLGPLLCSSPAEQIDFSDRFDRWLMRWQEANIPPELPIVIEHGLDTITRQATWWRWALGSGVALTLVSIVLYYILGIKPTPSTTDTVTLTPTVPPVSTPLASTIDTPTQATVPTQQILPSDSLTTTTPELAATTPTPAPFIDIISAVGSYVWGWPLLLTTLLILVPFCLWQGWWYYRAHLFLRRYATNRDPELEKLTIKGSTEALFPPLALFQLARAFRQRREAPSQQLDIAATVTQTVLRAGWFTPSYGRQQLIPEYLVLIDRASRRDQQASFVTELIQRLEAQKVFVNIYYFASDPRICFAANDREPPRRLLELLTRYPQHRLILFTDARGLFNALTGQLEPWSDQLMPWRERFLFTPEPTSQWGYRERELAANFVVLPTTSEGLQQVMRVSRQQPTFSPRLGLAKPPLPATLLARPQRWLNREPPSSDQIDEMFAGLRLHLGEMGFTWLSACAVYPALDWHLTLYLGNTLTTLVGAKYLQTDLLLELARLPWFRHNYMPDWLRQRLLEALSPAAEREIRAVLTHLLLTALGDGAVGFPLELARQPLLQPLFHLLAHRSRQDSPLRDYIFLNFLIGRASRRLAFALPAPLPTLLVSQRPLPGVTTLQNFWFNLRRLVTYQWPTRQEQKPPTSEEGDRRHESGLHTGLYDREDETDPERAGDQVSSTARTVLSSKAAEESGQEQTNPPSIDVVRVQKSQEAIKPIADKRKIGPYRYRLLEDHPFTETRMSLLWLANEDTQHQSTGERVIIKIARLKEELFSLTNQRAIENEANWLRKLYHPGIIKLRPIAEDGAPLFTGQEIYLARSNFPGNPWFIVTDYLPGGTLQSLVEERRNLSVNLALQITQQLAETLTYIHAQGCVHRELKPNNVLFAQKPTEQQLTAQSPPILIDFGIACALGKERATGGTVPWMAPESIQARKRGVRLMANPAVDIYALGLTFYYMLTGKRPPENSQRNQLLIQPSALIDVAPHRQTALAAAINQLIQQATADDPEERITAVEFARQTNTLLSITKPKLNRLPATSWMVTGAASGILSLALIIYRDLIAALTTSVISWASGMLQSFNLSLAQSNQMLLIGLLIGAFSTILLGAILLYVLRRRQPYPASFGLTGAPANNAGGFTEPQRIVELDKDATNPADVPNNIAPAYLVYVSGNEHLAKRLSIDAGREVRIGRKREYCDLVIDDKRVSRLHAVISERNDGFHIRDEGSAGGTFVNRHQLGISHDRLLKHGDLINFNAIEYRFEMTSVERDIQGSGTTSAKDATEPILSPPRG